MLCESSQQVNGMRRDLHEEGKQTGEERNAANLLHLAICGKRVGEKSDYRYQQTQINNHCASSELRTSTMPSVIFVQPLTNSASSLIFLPSSRLEVLTTTVASCVAPVSFSAGVLPFISTSTEITALAMPEVTSSVLPTTAVDLG